MFVETFIHEGEFDFELGLIFEKSFKLEHDFKTAHFGIKTIAELND